MSAEQFDLEEIYDEQIAPLMTQIIAICAKHKLPIAATFEYATDDFCTTTMGFDRASERMQGFIEKMKPRQHHTLAVTEATGPSGHTTISVSRIS